MSKKSASSVRRILVAVDGSKHSDKAVGLGIDMANKWQAKIYIIHVTDAVFKKILPGYLAIPKVPKFEYERIRKQILDPAEAKIKKAGIKGVESIIADGHPADEIINTARKKKVDLIIMGNRGLGSFSRAVMGSVSAKVCNHAPCTCITVK